MDGRDTLDPSFGIQPCFVNYVIGKLQVYLINVTPVHSFEAESQHHRLQQATVDRTVPWHYRSCTIRSVLLVSYLHLTS